MTAQMWNVHKKNKIRVNSKLVKKILRTVPQNETFYFFTGMGEYTGE